MYYADETTEAAPPPKRKESRFSMIVEAEASTSPASPQPHGIDSSPSTLTSPLLSPVGKALRYGASSGPSERAQPAIDKLASRVEVMDMVCEDFRATPRNLNSPGSRPTGTWSSRHVSDDSGIESPPCDTIERANVKQKAKSNNIFSVFSSGRDSRSTVARSSGR
jgi:hypothetical protein